MKIEIKHPEPHIAHVFINGRFAIELCLADEGGEGCYSILSQHATLVMVAEAAEKFVKAYIENNGYFQERKDLQSTLSAWRSTLDGGKEVGK